MKLVLAIILGAILFVGALEDPAHSAPQVDRIL